MEKQKRRPGRPNAMNLDSERIEAQAAAWRRGDVPEIFPAPQEDRAHLIAGLLVASGSSVVELAGRMGFNYGTVYRWLRGGGMSRSIWNCVRAWWRAELEKPHDHA